jgi:ubiquinone/menaquinone biosynthesis C-methylase UbiE
MSDATGYVLGQSAEAARRLALQDTLFAEASEGLLDDLALPPTARVVELGCGPGSFSARVLRRIPQGTLVGIDASAGLLAQARASLAGQRFETVLADAAELGPWLDGADAVVARAVLHHFPMAEFVLGRLRARLRPGTPVGFVEPDFRALLARLAYLEATGRTELAPLRVWATAINQLYAAHRISPAVGATLAAALEAAGYRRVRSAWLECRSDAPMIANIVQFCAEVQGRLDELGILAAEENVRCRALLEALPPEALPPAWGMFRVAAEA